MQRKWINQPSKHQPLHHLHGTNVLAQHEYDDTWVAYFLSGDTICMQIPRSCLSSGWRPSTPVSEYPELNESSVFFAEPGNKYWIKNLQTGEREIMKCDGHGSSGSIYFIEDNSQADRPDRYIRSLDRTSALYTREEFADMIARQKYRINSIEDLRSLGETSR